MSLPTGLKVALALNACALLAVASIAVHIGGGFAPVSFPPDEALPRTVTAARDGGPDAPAATAIRALPDAPDTLDAPARADGATPATGGAGADTAHYPAFVTPDLGLRPWLTQADGSIRFRD